MKIGFRFRWVVVVVACAVTAVAEEKIGGAFFEGEGLKVVERTGEVRGQDLRSYGVGKWSGSSHVWWTGGKVGERIEFSLPVAGAGRYRIGVGMTKAKDYGTVEFALDGKTISGAIDLYSNEVVHTGTVALGGEHLLSAGEHRFSVTMVGANPKAVKAFMFGLDYVVLHAGDEAGLLAIKPRPSVAAPKRGGGQVKAGNDLAAEPLTAAEQLATFVVPEGFVVELVASEETGVPKPTSIAFDDAGRLWATTAVEYPRDRDPEVWKKPGRDRVVVIDAPQLRGPQPVRAFAEGMVMPMSVLPYGDGAFVAQGPEILFLDDADGDGRADGRKILLEGFGVQDTHTLPHQLVRVPGGRIVFSQGVLNNGTIMDAGGRRYGFDKTLIASMTPEGGGLRIIGAGMNNIWAWAQNRVGRVFIHEANDLGYSLVQFEEDSSYPSFRATKMHPEAPVHPPTAVGLDLGGTGFSGIAVCEDRSGSFPAPWHGRLFVANPILGKINSAGGTLGDDDVWSFEKHGDLVTCGDPMFRPVFVAFGPDGCLYIADWYNRIISHNEVARDHPGRDKKRGRIWRVRHVGQPQAEIVDATKTPTALLPAALKSDSTWAMRAAWHQMADRQDRSVIPELVALLGDEGTAVDVRIHALWSLEELGYFEVGLWARLLGQASVDLRREAVRALSTARIPISKAAPLLKVLAGEGSWSVRYEVLRYFRRAEGALGAEHLAWLRGWSAGQAMATKVKGWGGEYLALDGSYQRAFQDFLMMLVETKTQLPVTVKSKWDGVIGKNLTPAEPRGVAERIAAVKGALGNVEAEEGRLLTRGICLTCHAIGGEGVGFAPPLDGSANRDLDGLLAAIVDPDAAIESVFRQYRIERKDGTILEGFNQGETGDAITLVLMGGAKQVVPIEEIKTAGYVEGKSVMIDVTGGMTAEQVASIVGYLRSVK